MSRPSSAAVLLGLLLGAAAWPPASARAQSFTDDDADTLINSFQAAYYARDCTGAYYKRDPNGGVSDFWRYAEMIEMQIDVYERTPSAENRARIAELIAGFDGRNTTLWSANGFNDDIMWAVIAHARAYQIIGDPAFRDIAKANWDLAYARGWDTVGDRVPPVGGFYWNTSRTSKNSATNFPATVAAYLLYQILGDEYYLTKANEVFTWGRTNLYNPENGLVYDGLGPNGRTPTTYNQGTFIASANFLGYHEDAVKAADFTMAALGSINPVTGGGLRLMSNYDPNTDGGGFNGIAMRWIAGFMKQHGLESRYLPWLQANAQAAWNIRRPSDNLSWTRTHLLTPPDFNLFAWGASNAVVAMAVVPPPESESPPPPVPAGLIAVPTIKGIALSWLASSPRYNVKRATSPGGPYETIGDALGTSFTDTSVASNATYYYVVSALNRVGESADSNEASTRSPQLPDGTRVAVADAMVRAGASANLTFGTLGDLLVKLDNNADLVRESFLRFDVSGLAEAPSVMLRLVLSSVGSDAATTTVAFEFVPDDTWSETGVTWNTRPAGSGTPFATVTGMALGQTLEVDVTDLVRGEAAGDGLLSLRLYGTVAGNNRIVAFGSRENCDVSVRPVLAHSSSRATLPPLALPRLSATAAANGAIVLSWPAIYGATRYNIKRATVSGGPYPILATATIAAHTDTSVANGSTYYYVVSAANGFGESPDSPEAVATSYQGTLTVDDGEAACSYVGDWTVSQEVPGFHLTGYRHDGNTGVAGGKSATCTPTLFVPGNYEVFVRAPAAAAHASNVQVEVHHLGGVATRVVNQRMNNNAYVSLGRHVFEAGTAGKVVIRNDGADGRVIADAARWVFASPAAPGNLTAVPGNAQVALSWTPPLGGATSYRVKRATAGGGGPYSVITTTSGTSYTDTTARNATTYYYRVSAVNVIGEGTDSPFVTVVMPVPPAIVTGPDAQTATVGDTVTFAVEAAGTAPSYQWRKDGAPLAGATGASLVLANVTTAAAGDYDVVVSNLIGSATSAPAALTVNRAVAAVVLAGLGQMYDGSPRRVSVATSPMGLPVSVTYDGSASPPTYPGSYAVAATVDHADYVGAASGTLVIDITALIRHAPGLSARVQGSLQVLLPESTALSRCASISGDLLVRGTPTVALNGTPSYGGTLDGNGAAAPSNFTVTLNSATLRHVVRRIDAIAMPAVAPPPAPTGTRDVELNRPSDAPGDFATIRNLTLNGTAGQIAVPPGTYGTFTANRTNGFTLGVAGATVPAVYNLKALVLNGRSRVQVLGPIVINLATGMSVNGNGTVGVWVNGSGALMGRPDWVRINVSSGGVALNTDAAVHGSVMAPAGTVSINGRSRLNGTVKADRLVINTSGSLSTPAP